MHTLDLILIASGSLLALLAVTAAFFGWRGESSLLAMHDTPTLSVAEVVERHRWALHGATPLAAPVEVVGTIECDTPLQTPYSEQLCVAYDYLVNEESERYVGRGRFGHGHEIEHNSTDLHNRRVPRFFVRDATGRIAVDTAGAQLDLRETVARYAHFTGLNGSEREIWREERALLIGHRVYVLGYLGDDGGVPILGRHPGDQGRRFLISHRDERTFAAAVRRRSYGLYLAAGLSLGAAALIVTTAIVF